MDNLDLTPIPQLRFEQGPSSHSTCSEHIRMTNAITQISTKMEGYMQTTNDTLDTIQEDVGEIKKSLVDRKVFEGKMDIRMDTFEKQGTKTIETIETLSNKLTTHMLKTAGGIAAGVGGGGGVLFLIYKLLGGK